MLFSALSGHLRSGAARTCVRTVTTASTVRVTDVTDKPERPRRSLFSVPGADARKIAKAQTLDTDSVVLDLEDGVAFDRKDDARTMVRETLRDETQTFGRSELCVRINGLDTGDLALRDLEAVLPCGRLRAVVVPKVETASDIHFVSRMIDALASNGGRDVRILAAVESALGVLNLRDIAATSKDGDRLDGLIFASEDYCADVEALRTPSATEMLVARSQLVLAAKAYGLQAIDMVHINFRNLESLEEECKRGRELGFTGKQAIHPNQISTIHKNFSPSEADVEFAFRIVEAYKATVASGKGACVVDDIVVDMPVYRWAVRIMERASAAGMHAS